MSLDTHSNTTKDAGRTTRLNVLRIINELRAMTDRKPANTKSKEKSKEKGAVVRSSIVNEYKITR